jgi:hypothetical protein
MIKAKPTLKKAKRRNVLKISGDFNLSFSLLLNAELLLYNGRND